MDAMYAMWVTTDEDGQEQYGDNYQSAKYLLEYHFFNAAWQDAGEWAALVAAVAWTSALHCTALHHHHRQRPKY
jgi:hypothetical protein